jgi:taurine dioxygenase
MSCQNAIFHKASSALGAYAQGVDLRRPLGSAIIIKIRQALIKYQVLFFEDQELSPTELVRFGNYFAPLDRYPFVEGMKDFPDVVEVSKKPNEQINFGGLWHTDTSYLECPPMASILYAKTIPPIGGDTLFANMYAAYDALSPRYKAMLEGLQGINSASKAAAADTRVHRIEERPLNYQAKSLTALHPLVRTHAESGHKALYCSDAHTVGINGMTSDEGKPILDYLYQLQQRPEFCFRFRWRVGCLAFWDNRCTQHNALNDYTGYARRMLRITLAGDRPY